MPNPKSAKVPSTLKLPWNNVAAMAASADGRTIVLAGELGQLVRLDTESWELVSWPSVDESGTVNALSVSDDGASVGVSIGGRKTFVEVRDAEGGVRISIPVPRTVRATFSPGGDLFVARVEADVDHPHAGLAFIDPSTKHYRPVEVGAVDSAVACFTGTGDRVLAFARRIGTDPREAHRVLRIDRDGAVRDLAATDFWDSYAAMIRIGPERALVRGYNFGWQLVDDDGTKIAAGARQAVLAACVERDGFVIAESRGKAVARYDAHGRRRPGSETIAKKRVDALATSGHLFLAESGQPGQVEIVSSS
jgi:hypothetical protein